MSVTRVKFHKAGHRYVSDDHKALFFKDASQGNWWHLQHRVPGGLVTLGLSAGGTVHELKRWAEQIVLAARERWEQETVVPCEGCGTTFLLTDDTVTERWTQHEDSTTVYFCAACFSVIDKNTLTKETN